MEVLSSESIIIHLFSNSTLKIYPNPANETVTILFNRQINDLVNIQVSEYQRIRSILNQYSTNRKYHPARCQQTRSRYVYLSRLGTRGTFSATGKFYYY
jgi:replication fork clamp-binding protein CrfC